MTGRGVLWAVLAVLAAIAAALLRARNPTIAPDVVAVVVVIAGLALGPAKGALTGLLAGWVLDLMPPGAALLGTSALAYAAAGLIAGRAHRPARVSPPVVAAIALLGYAAALLITVALGLLGLRWSLTGSLTDWSTADWPIPPRTIATTALCTVVATTLVAPVLARADARLRR